MAKMVRKKIYIQEGQEVLLKRISKARGISEADLIRRAIEREVTGENLRLFAPDHTAWEAILSLAKRRKADPAGSGAYRWKRQDAYEAREKRSCFSG
jgi:hypothetical protein